MSNKSIPELDTIEFKNATSITEYSRRLRALGRDLAAELDASAEEVEAVLGRQAGHPLLMGADVRRRARRVARRLRRARELATGVAVEAVRFNADFRTEFADVIKPAPPKRPAFDFSS
jgi:CTP:molybdopterin cytidylyltransferase MocA